jgi:hypothetical protein
MLYKKNPSLHVTSCCHESFDDVGQSLPIHKEARVVALGSSIHMTLLSHFHQHRESEEMPRKEDSSPSLTSNLLRTS